MLGNKRLYGVKTIFNMKDKTLLEILDLSDCDNILQTIEWDENGIPLT